MSFFTLNFRPQVPAPGANTAFSHFAAFSDQQNLLFYQWQSPRSSSCFTATQTLPSVRAMKCFAIQAGAADPPGGTEPKSWWLHYMWQSQKRTLKLLSHICLSKRKKKEHTCSLSQIFAFFIFFFFIPRFWNAKRIYSKIIKYKDVVVAISYVRNR